MSRRHSHRRPVLPPLVAVLVALAAAWIVGLFWFVAQIPVAVDDESSRTDAIVVLTGGQGRLSEGLDLLRRGLSDRLFVSGVYRGVDVKTLLQASADPTEGLESRIGIGDAVNTIGNAAETAAWAAENDVRSLRLVTGSYHMPRSVLEFANAMPDVVIVPHPVFSGNVKIDHWWAWPGTTMLVAGEFTKYIAARVRLAFRPTTGDTNP